MNKHFKFQVLKQKLLANFIFIIFLANVIKLKHSWDRFGKFIEMVKIELSGNFAFLLWRKMLVSEYSLLIRTLISNSPFLAITV